MNIEPELENIEEIHERETFTDRHAGQVSGVPRDCDNISVLTEKKGTSIHGAAWRNRYAATYAFSGWQGPVRPSQTSTLHAQYEASYPSRS